AEQAGFDGICVNEHHQNGYGLMPSPNLMAAALARRTSRAKLIILGRPKIVWLHGPHGVRKNDPVIAELAKRPSVIAPVAPGFNNVDELDEVRDVHDLALHYDDVFEALGLDGISLVGHSFGAMIAAEVAAHVPKRVDRLVLISPFGLWRDDYPVADLFARPY